MFKERKRENIFLKIVLTELVPHVLWIINLWCEMCLLGRSLFDEMNCVDLISANAWDVKKSTIALIAHLLTELSHYPCWTIYWEGEICPLWRPLSLQLLMLMTWMVQIRELIMQDMWKKSKITLIAHRLSELAPHLCQNMLRGWNLSSLTASFSVISNVDDMNGAYLQSANARNSNKINNRIDSPHT